MSSHSITRSPEQLDADREKRLVALSSVFAAILLTGFKIVVGVTTGSLGILSEAAHSGLDLFAAIITFWAVRAAGQPADSQHTYGHGKYENLSALFETILLLITCAWILYEVVHRLFFVQTTVLVTPWAFVVIIVSVVVDFSRSRALAKVARKYQSQALEADALHFSTDIWSSAVVLAGLIGVYFSHRLHLPWLEKADALAAAAVALIVVWVSAKLGYKTINDLLDAIPPELKNQVETAAKVPGVLGVQKVRIRRSGPEIFADITIAVSRDANFERAHDIATTAENAVREILPGADLVVHVEPVDSGHEGIHHTVRLLASRHGLGAHNIRVYRQRGRTSLDLHLEIEETLRVREAHHKVTAFEKQLRTMLPELADVVSHIEPAAECSPASTPEPQEELVVRQTLESMCGESNIRFSPHQVVVQRVLEKISVSFHCAIDADASITDAHALTEEMERRLRQRLPELGRVVIHVEPPDSEEDA